jgi:hypothetical protein
MSEIAIWTKPLRGGRYRVFGGWLLRADQDFFWRTTMDDNIPTVMSTWVQRKLAFWRRLGDEMAKGPLKTHTIYL